MIDVLQREETGCTKSADEIVTENHGIMARLRAGDPKIMPELIERYQGRLRGYLIRLTSDRDLCEDLLQETWMRVLSHGAQFKGESQFVTWLFAVARNLTFDTQRKLARIRQSEPLPESGEDWHPSLVSSDPTPIEYCIDQESARVLMEGIRSLTPRHREIVSMRLEQDLSLEEIARRMGLSLSSVKSRFYRGLVLLKPKLTAISL